MSEYRRRLSVDFLTRELETTKHQYQRRKFDTLLQGAMLSVAPSVLAAFSESSGYTTTVFQIVDRLQLPVSTLAPVLERLRELGYVEYLREDLKGNHEVRLTESGKLAAK